MFKRPHHYASKKTSDTQIHQRWRKLTLTTSSGGGPLRGKNAPKFAAKRRGVISGPSKLQEVRARDRGCPIPDFPVMAVFIQKTN